MEGREKKVSCSAVEGSRLPLLETADGSRTLFSSLYGEAYHSASGALTESFVKFCGPCRIERLARGGRLSLLDVGFGLGYNILAALAAARRSNPDCRVEIVSLEKDVPAVETLDVLHLPAEYGFFFGVVKAVAADHRFEGEGITVDLMHGDARSGIRMVDRRFDAVFLDPFSPAKNPELWTVEFFGEIYDRMEEDAVLATYSAATPVRCGLIEAGFRIGPGPGDGMKRGGTVAAKSDVIREFGAEEMERLSRSPERVPYHDPGLDSTAQEIISLRERLKSGKL